MKKQIRLLFLWILGILIPTIPWMTQGSGGAFDPMEMPKFKTFVNDYAGLLSPDQLQDLNTHAQTIQDTYWAQIVTVLFPHRKGHELFDITLKAFNENGIGDKEKNDWVLLAIATEEKKIRIMVGYGMEDDLPDLLANQMIDKRIRPQVNQGDHYSGVVNFYEHIIPLLEQHQKFSSESGRISFKLGNLTVKGYSFINVVKLLSTVVVLPLLCLILFIRTMIKIRRIKQQIKQIEKSSPKKQQTATLPILRKQQRMEQRKATGLWTLTAPFILFISFILPSIGIYWFIGVIFWLLSIWESNIIHSVWKRNISVEPYWSGSSWSSRGSSSSSRSSSSRSSWGFSGWGGRSGWGGAGD